MTTLFDNLALVEHVDDVGLLDGTEAMRDGDCGTTLCCDVEGGLDGALGCTVE